MHVYSGMPDTIISTWNKWTHLVLQIPQEWVLFLSPFYGWGNQKHKEVKWLAQVLDGGSVVKCKQTDSSTSDDSCCPEAVTVTPKPGWWPPWPMAFGKLWFPGFWFSRLGTCIVCGFHRWIWALPGLPTSSWFPLAIWRCLFSGSKPPYREIIDFPGIIIKYFLMVMRG